MGRHDQAERAPDPADLLDRDRVGEGVEPCPTFVLGDRDPEPAKLPDPSDDVRREAALALMLLDDRRDLGLHELPDRVAQQHVLRGEVEVHRPEPITAA